MKRISVKRIASLITALSMAASLSACGGASNSFASDEAPATAAPAAKAAPSAEKIEAPVEVRSEDAVPEAASETAAAEAAAAGDADGEAVYYTAEEAAPVTSVAAMREEAVEEEYEAAADELGAADEVMAADEAAPETEAEKAPVSSQWQAGLLTAGEWNDNDNWGFFTNLVNSVKITYPAYGIDPRFRTAVTVKDKNGQPVVNAKVTLYYQQEPSWTAVTDKNGIVYLFGKGDTVSVTGLSSTAYYRLPEAVYGNETVEPAAETETPESTAVQTEQQGRKTVGEAIQIVIEKCIAEVFGSGNEEAPAPQTDVKPEDTRTMEQVAEDVRQSRNAFVSREVEVTFDDIIGNYKDMQVMFIVDTTGSMGDELMFLQYEFSAIAQTVGNENVTYSVNFYKDEGDIYKTRTNPFTDDISALDKKLKSEVADGGGDTPEAVSEILDECMHAEDWREDAVKIAFLIYDAPPHSDAASLAKLERAMKAAAAQGIRVIPVVSSNSERETELFGRGLAIFTGGTYVFLTDDSGVGDSHLEPVIGAYQVESLYDIIIRLIEEYRQ